MNSILPAIAPIADQAGRAARTLSALSTRTAAATTGSTAAAKSTARSAAAAAATTSEADGSLRPGLAPGLPLAPKLSKTTRSSKTARPAEHPTPLATIVGISLDALIHRTN